MPRTTTSAVGSQIIGTAIRRARIDEHLTQDELGRRMGSSGSYVANVEAGRENLTVGQVAAFAEAMGRVMELELAAVERELVILPDAGL